MRVVVQNDPMHPDNLGHIVTHIGMNLDERLKEFKEFENDDQDFWNKVINADEPDISNSVLAGDSRLSIRESVVVSDEIVESLWEEDFAKLEDEEIIKDLRERFSLLGLDPNQVEATVRAESEKNLTTRAPAEPFAIQPQRELQESRKRLNETARRSAKLLLNNVKLGLQGRELPYQYKSLNISGRNNFVSAIMMIHREVNLRLGVDRNQASVEEIKEILENFDDLLHNLVRRVHKARNEYERTQT